MGQGPTGREASRHMLNLPVLFAVFAKCFFLGLSFLPFKDTAQPLVPRQVASPLSDAHRQRLRTRTAWYEVRDLDQVVSVAPLLPCQLDGRAQPLAGTVVRLYAWYLARELWDI